MICTNCSHAKVDHLTGKCVNRKTRFDPALGALTTLCPCKTFDEKKKGAAPAVVLPAADVAAAPANTESVGTAPEELTTESEASTETTPSRRKR